MDKQVIPIWGKSMKTQKGFTLVEVLAVVGLLSVVLAMMMGFVQPVLRQLRNAEGAAEANIAGDYVCQYLRERLAYADEICITQQPDFQGPYYPVYDSDDELYEVYETYWDEWEDWDSWTVYADLIHFAAPDDDEFLLERVAVEHPEIVPVTVQDDVTGIAPGYLSFFNFKRSDQLHALNIEITRPSERTLTVRVEITDNRAVTQYRKHFFVECLNVPVIYTAGGVLSGTAEAATLQPGDYFKNPRIFINHTEGVRLLQSSISID